MSEVSVVTAIVGSIVLTALTVPLQSRAEAVFGDDELSTAISGHRAIDSVEIRALPEPDGSVGWVIVRAEAIFSKTDAEIQKIADFATEMFREKYQQNKIIEVQISGERDGLLHTIWFRGKNAQTVVRGEVTCSDPRCGSDAIFNSLFTG